MKFKHENKRTGRTFQCKLRKEVCEATTKSGRPCRNRVVIGLKKCHLHRSVQVKQSNIPNAGKGLFAKKEYRNNDLIGHYRGQVLSNRQHSRRYGASQKDQGPYSLQVRKDTVVDSSCHRFVMSMANGTARQRDANARFVSRMNSETSGKVAVRATKRIRIGDEILVHYGRDYFRVAGNSTHTTR